MIMSLVVILFSGCRVHISTGGRDYMSGETYPDAESYQTGSFTYTAAEVTAVEIYWRSGEVELIETEEEELQVSESGDLPRESAMHWLLDNGTLRIRFCGSGEKIDVDPNDKYPTVELPKGIALSVHTTSAAVKAETLEQQNVLVAALSGRTELGEVTAQSVDLSSSSGSIAAESIMADTLRCGSSSGTVWIERAVVETVGIKTSSGSVKLDEVSAEGITVGSSSGSVKLGLTAIGEAEIHTSSGSITLRLPEEGASLTYSAGGGKLHTALAYERRGDLYVFGSGTGSITVESGSGSLTVKD